jgi:hypothetical protein
MRLHDLFAGEEKGFTAKCLEGFEERLVFAVFFKGKSDYFVEDHHDL